MICGMAASVLVVRRRARRKRVRGDLDDRRLGRGVGLEQVDARTDLASRGSLFSTKYLLNVALIGGAIA
jgi:hypothetical protein